MKVLKAMGVARSSKSTRPMIGDFRNSQESSAESGGTEAWQGYRKFKKSRNDLPFGR